VGGHSPNFNLHMSAFTNHLWVAGGLVTRVVTL